MRMQSDPFDIQELEDHGIELKKQYPSMISNSNVAEEIPLLTM